MVNCVRHGMSNRTIARRLGVSLDAVKFHIVNALGKLQLDRRSDLQHWTGAPMDSAVKEGKEAVPEKLALGRIGQISREVGDIEKAEAWYRDVLGLKHLYTFGNLAFFDCDGTRLFLEQGEGKGEGDSLIYFKVEDIHGAHAELQRRGVEFRGAPHMIHRHENGVEEWMAFFDDPDGKPLGIMAQVSPR